MALDFQIILLPRTDYWDWLAACRRYAVKFGANLTSDPGVAGRYMAPMQVVTLPVFAGAYPELGDPVAWFRQNHSGVRLDTIDAKTPAAMGKALRRRVKDNDRYGASRRPFHLLWPTDFHTVTQAFGVNPQIYRRYGMPGHEGLDFRALTNTNIYACADGDVYEVHGHPKDHAYGIHIRIQHRDGYKTVYAHLAKAIARKGDHVVAGQLIGRADSTGNSSASHLHLSLKRDGATARRETTYPKDIIDPTPFLVWPASKTPKSPGLLRAPRLGLHLVSRDGLRPAQATSAANSGADVVLISHLEPAGTIDALRASRRRRRFLVRVAEAPPADGTTPAHFVAHIAAEIGRLYRMGLRDFELTPYPNEHGGGFGQLWKDGQSFAAWWVDVVRRLREVFPEGRFGFPTLAYGGNVTGRQQETLSFLHQAADAVCESDWLGLACPTSRQDRVLSGYLQAHPEKEIIVTEAEVGANESSPEDLAIRCVAFCEALRDTTVAAVLYRAPDGPASGEALNELPWEALMILGDGGGVASRSEAIA